MTDVPGTTLTPSEPTFVSELNEDFPVDRLREPLRRQQEDE